MNKSDNQWPAHTQHPLHPYSNQQQQQYSRYHRHHHHWWYVWIPVVASIVWLGTILALLITWLAQHRPHYVSMSPGQKIAYISDVGADVLKPLFIVGCVITAVGFCMSLMIERWLRNSGRQAFSFFVL